MPDASTPSARAVLPLTTICGSVELGRRNAVLEVEVAFGPDKARLQQALVDLDDLLVLFAEGARDLLGAELRVEAVQVAQDSENEHVLALARVGHQLVALVLERNFVDAEAGVLEHGDGVDIGSDDLRVAVFAPHALQQDLRARFQFAGRTRPISTCSLKATTRSVSSPPLLSLRADPDADPEAPATLRAGGWISAGNDLRGPDAVAGSAPRWRPATGRSVARLRPSR